MPDEYDHLRESADQAEPVVPPLPYLTRPEVQRQMEVLGFIIGPDSLNYPAGHQKDKFIALQKLLAGAIAEWSDLELTEDDQTWADVEAELQEWTEEWLVG